MEIDGMTAHAEFMSEKRQVDSLLEDGYAIAGAGEDLDGMHLYFTKLTELPPNEAGAEAPDGVPAVRSTVRTAKLLLLNPDARQYVASIVLAQKGKDDAS
ncbi:hypothetical protein [Cohnella sp. GCM10027633]|uniref:hypothetical protein n=1 Tax=unclassified Cohnella TaxID=2636738 RepID=UPI003641B056